MTERPAVPLRLAGLHLLVLWSFAVAQPLFDLLGKNGEFFAARGSTRWDAVVVARARVVVPPAHQLGLKWIAGPARWAVHALFVAGLVALFVLQAIRGAGGPGKLLLFGAAVAGLAGAWLYLRWRSARLVLTVLAPAPLLFLALFLFNSDVSRLSVASDAHAAAERPRAPVVLIAISGRPISPMVSGWSGV